MGAELEMGNRVVRINGSGALHGTEYTIMNGPDELVSYIIAAAISGGELRIENADLNYAPTDIKVLREAGMEIFEWGGSVYVSAPHPLKPIDIFTTPFPGINSDMQPPIQRFCIDGRRRKHCHRYALYRAISICRGISQIRH